MIDRSITDVPSATAVPLWHLFNHQAAHSTQALMISLLVCHCTALLITEYLNQRKVDVFTLQ